MKYCFCGDQINPNRVKLGYNTCLTHGEQQAKKHKHTIVTLHKSHQMVVRDLQLLKNLNKYAT